MSEKTEVINALSYPIIAHGGKRKLIPHGQGTWLYEFAFKDKSSFRMMAIGRQPASMNSKVVFHLLDKFKGTHAEGIFKLLVVYHKGLTVLGNPTFGPGQVLVLDIKTETKTIVTATPSVTP